MVQKWKSQQAGSAAGGTRQKGPLASRTAWLVLDLAWGVMCKAEPCVRAHWMGSPPLQCL